MIEAILRDVIQAQVHFAKRKREKLKEGLGTLASQTNKLFGLFTGEVAVDSADSRWVKLCEQIT